MFVEYFYGKFFRYNTCLKRILLLAQNMARISYQDSTFRLFYKIDICLLYWTFVLFISTFVLFASAFFFLSGHSLYKNIIRFSRSTLFYAPIDSLFALGLGGGGVDGTPRRIGLRKEHVGGDFDIHNGPQGGKFDSTAILDKLFVTAYRFAKRAMQGLWSPGWEIDLKWRHLGALHKTAFVCQV